MSYEATCNSADVHDVNRCNTLGTVVGQQSLTCPARNPDIVLTYLSETENPCGAGIQSGGCVASSYHTILHALLFLHSTAALLSALSRCDLLRMIRRLFILDGL